MNTAVRAEAVGRQTPTTQKTLPIKTTRMSLIERNGRA
jgi:hypothetical protein